VREYGLFLKEVKDAQAIRNRIIDCCETAVFKDQDPEEAKRLLHCVVVGGGPTGVEFAGELQDFFIDDLQKWIPAIKDDFHITLIEALPNVLPSFSRQLIDYTEKTFKEEKITIRTKTMVKKVTPKYIECETTDPDGTKRMERIPYGLLVWATGNAVRPVVHDLMAQLPEQAQARRGLLVNESLQVRGAPGVWAAGDCAVASTAGGGGYAPTAQVAGQQGGFLARALNARARSDALEEELAGVEERLGRAATPEARDALLAEFKAVQRRLRRVQARIGPFEYSHQGSLAYIGSEKAVADISWLSGNLATGGTLTYLFWRSAYLSMTWSGKWPSLLAVNES
jgi:NADH:ubiquinone reductase (non-electrogenic)